MQQARRAAVPVRAILVGVVGWAVAVLLVAAAPASDRSPAGSLAFEGGPRLEQVSYTSTVLADSPSLLYRMDETSGTAAHDTVGTGNNLNSDRAGWGQSGALANDSNTAAYVGCCGRYMGSDSAVGLPTGDAARSVEFWFVGSVYQLPQRLTSWGSGTNGVFQVNITNGATLQVDRGGASSSFVSSHGLLDGRWHQVVVTYVGGQLAAYADGELLGTATLASGLATTATQFLLGFQGPSFDEVAVYPTALSAAQVAAHFAASGNSRPLAPGTPVLTGGANKVTVSWPAATAGVPAGSPQVSRYVISAGAGSEPGRVIAATGAKTTVVFSGLPAGVAYTFQVTPFNQFGVGPTVTSASATPTGTRTTYASLVQADAPSLYDRRSDPDGDVSADSSGTGNDLVGSGTRGYTGALKSDTDFGAGVGCCGRYFLTSSSAGLPTGNGARTVEGWIAMSPSYPAPIASWGDFSVSPNGYDRYTIRVTGGGNALYFTSPRQVIDGTWHYIVVTYAAQQVSVYVDGDHIGTQSFSQPLATAASPMQVGYQGPAVDEFAIYPYALSAAQVATHFFADKGRSEGALS